MRPRTRSFLWTAAVVAALFLVANGDSHAAQGLTERVSVDSAGNEANSYSSDPSISDDGRLIAFSSSADNLVTGDANRFCDRNSDNVFADDCGDVFVHDRVTGDTSLISVNSAGLQANKDSSHPSVSGDGRFIVFESNASNLVSGDIDCPDISVVSLASVPGRGCPDVFLRDRVSGITEQVSVNSAGEPADGDSVLPSVSDDGRFVAFASSNSSNLAPGAPSGVFVRDRQTSSTRFIANGGFPEISGDGRFVAFQSDTTDLVPDDTNDATDIFVYDMQTAQMERVSVDSSGDQATNADPLLGGWLASSFFPAISSDGRYVAFSSNASDLVADDANSMADIFVHNRETGQTVRVSVDGTGHEPDGSSYGTPSISGDGRFVAFHSFASNLVPDDTNACGFPDPRNCADVFVHDLQTGVTYITSLSSEGIHGNQDTTQPSISSDGQSVAFSSFASNLVTGDTATCLPPPHPTSCQDIFVREGLSTPAPPAPSATPVVIPTSPLSPAALPQTGGTVDHGDRPVLPAAATLGILLLSGFGLQLAKARLRGKRRA